MVKPSGRVFSPRSTLYTKGSQDRCYLCPIKGTFDHIVSGQMYERSTGTEMAWQTMVSNISIVLLHRHLCHSQTDAPTRSATATHKDLGSSCVPKEVTGTAWSHILLSFVAAAKRWALVTWSALFIRLTKDALAASMFHAFLHKPGQAFRFIITDMGLTPWQHRRCQLRCLCQTT